MKKLKQNFRFNTNRIKLTNVFVNGLLEPAAFSMIKTLFIFTELDTFLKSDGLNTETHFANEISSVNKDSIELVFSLSIANF